MQPQNPDPKFDFMLKNNQPAKGRLALPAMSKPIKVVLAAVVGIILLIIASSVLSGRNKGITQPVINTLARGQETLRVTTEVQTLNLQDPATQALAATVTSTLSSDQQQLEKYLTANHSKFAPAQLAADTDKTVDAQMSSASQNNNLDQTYKSYLIQALAKYQTDLGTAYNAAGPNGKTIIESSLDGVNTLLSNPPLKNQ